MIFDDLEDDELFTPNNFERTKHSAKSVEFETSLDELMNRENAVNNADKPLPTLFEVFQIQLNERFFNIPLAGKKDAPGPKTSDEPRAKNSNGFVLRLKEAENLPDPDKISLGLSQKCDAEEMQRNIKAMRQDSFSSHADSESDSSSDSDSEDSVEKVLFAEKSRDIAHALSNFENPTEQNIEENPKRKTDNQRQSKSHHRISKKTEKRTSDSTVPWHPCSCKEFGNNARPVVERKNHFSLDSLSRLNLNMEECDEIQSLVSLDEIQEYAQPKFRFSNDACFICQKNYMPKELVARLFACGHHFHKSCLEAALGDWTQSNLSPECPQCKLKLL